jgi:hypothetical protein
LLLMTPVLSVFALFSKNYYIGVMMQIVIGMMVTHGIYKAYEIYYPFQLFRIEKLMNLFLSKSTPMMILSAVSVATLIIGLYRFGKNDIENG